MSRPGLGNADFLEIAKLLVVTLLTKLILKYIEANHLSICSSSGGGIIPKCYTNFVGDHISVSHRVGEINSECCIFYSL